MDWTREAIRASAKMEKGRQEVNSGRMTAGTERVLSESRWSACRDRERKREWRRAGRDGGGRGTRWAGRGTRRVDSWPSQGVSERGSEAISTFPSVSDHCRYPKSGACSSEINYTNSCSQPPTANSNQSCNQACQRELPQKTTSHAHTSHARTSTDSCPHRYERLRCSITFRFPCQQLSTTRTGGELSESEARTCRSSLSCQQFPRAPVQLASSYF